MGAAVDNGARRSGPRRRHVALVVAAVAAAAAWSTLGPPGPDAAAPPGPTVAARPLLRSLPPDAFAARAAQPGVFVVNVHVPYDGEIAGTDAFVPFDRIVGAAALPADRSAEILLYCRSGRMSAIAAEALTAAGYSDVADLAGGMDAWAAAGRAIDRLVR